MPVAQPFLNTPGQVGALAGYSDGMRMSYGLADLDREFRDRDLANKYNTLKYEEDLANVPLNEAQRGVKMGLAGIDQSLIDQGLVQKSKEDEFALTGQKVESGRQAIDTQTRIERGEAVQEGLQILKNPSLANSEVWTDYYNKMTEKHKMRGLSPNFQDPKNAALLQAAHTAYVNSGPQVRALALNEEKAESAVELARIRAKASSDNTAALIADRTGAKWDALTPEKQSRALAQEEMKGTGGILSVARLKAVAETSEKKDDKTISEIAEGMKSDLRRDLVGVKGMNDAKIHSIALQRAKQYYDENQMISAWGSLGSPPIPAIDLKDMEKTYPNFVDLVRNTPGKEAKDVFINRPDPTSGQPAAKAPAQAQPTASGGLSSATAADKAEVERLLSLPKYQGQSREAIYMALQNYKKRTQQAPTQAPISDVPGMPTGLGPEPPPRPLPPAMQGMGPQTPQQWLGR